MKLSDIRSQVWLIGAGYAAVFAIAAILIFVRHMAELNDPAGASGGMYAFGELLMYIFIACLFMIPTALLIWFVAGMEAVYTGYSKFLLGLGVSAPVCLGILFFGRSNLAESLNNFCFVRLMASPFVLAGIGFSWLVSKFDRARKLVSYAFLIEALTMAAGVALIIAQWKHGQP
jgi:hypothetical protein